VESSPLHTHRPGTHNANTMAEAPTDDSPVVSEADDEGASNAAAAAVQPHRRRAVSDRSAEARYMDWLQEHADNVPEGHYVQHMALLKDFREMKERAERCVDNAEQRFIDAANNFSDARQVHDRAANHLSDAQQTLDHAVKNLHGAKSTQKSVNKKVSGATQELKHLAKFIMHDQMIRSRFAIVLRQHATIDEHEAIFNDRNNDFKTMKRALLFNLRVKCRRRK